MPDLVTLGFEFKSTAAQKNITDLVAKLEQLNLKADLTKAIFAELKTNMSETAKVVREVSKAIKTLPNLSKLSGDKIKPVPQNTLDSFVKLQESAKLANDSVQKLRTDVKSLKPVGVVSLGQELDKTNAKANSLLGTFNKILSSGTYFRFISASLKESISFGEKVAQIASISQEFDTSKLRQEILNISSEFGNAAKLTDALYYAYSSGVRGTEKDMVSFTAQMGKLATVIRASVTPTINAVTSVMNAYGLSAKNSSELTDLFYGIVKQGKASGEQLASSIGQVIPTAATAGVELDELGASIASLTKVIQTRNAITYFNNMLSKMLKPTKGTRLAAQKLGLDLSLSAVQAKGFVGMMEEIRAKTKDSQEAILSIFPDLRGQRAALHLLGNGWRDFQEQLRFFGDKAGVADAAMKTLSGDINYQLSVLPTTLGKIRIAVGDAITEFLTLRGTLTPVVAAFNRMGEGTQKVIGTITALVGGVTVLKTAVFAFNSAKALEIRNNEIIAAQHAREIKQRLSLVAVMQKQAASSIVASASANVAKAASNVGKLAFVLEERNARAAAASVALDQARAEYEVARATNVSSTASAAYNRMIQAETQFLVLNNKAERTNLLLLKAKIAQMQKNIALMQLQNKSNVANGASNIFSQFTSGTGFGGGFLKGFGRGGFKALSQWTKPLLTAAKSVGSFTQVVTFFGSALGKVAAVVLKIFSPLNLLISGIAAVAIGAIDWIQAGFKLKNTVFIKKAGDAIYNFFDDTVKQAERIKAIDKRVAEIKNFQLDMDIWAQDLIAGFSNKSALPEKSLFNEVMETYKSAMSVLSSSDFNRRLAEMQKNKKKLEELRQIAARDENSASRYLDISTGALGLLFGEDSEQFKRYQKEMEEAKKINQHADLKGIMDRALQERLKNALTPEEMIGIKSAYENYWKAQKEAIIKQKEEAAKQAAIIERAVKADQSWVEKNIRTAQKASQDILNMYQGFYDAINSVSASVEKVRFFTLSPEQQMKETEKSFTENIQEFYDVYKNDPALAKKAFDNAVKAHKTIVNDAKKKIEKYKEFQTSLRKDAFDALLKSTKKLPDQLKIIRAEAARLEKEAKAEEDLQKKYGLSKRAIELQISGMTKEIEVKKRLADSEAKANRNTLKLIQSMDKFKSTALDAVDANSVEAVKLQARAFSAMPKFTPSTTAQSSYAASEANLQKAYAQMAQMAESMRVQAEERQRQEQERLKNQQAQMEAYMAKTAEVMAHWQKSMAELDKKQQAMAEKLQKALGSLEENSKKTADNTGALARKLGSPVTYGA